MKPQPLWKISVSTNTEAEDAVAELLATCAGPGPSAYTDVETGVTTVSTYVTSAPKEATLRKTLRAELKRLRDFGLNIGSGRIAISKLAPENWADSWKRHFPALEVGTKLLVKPSWIKRKLRPGQKLVVLDPGLSFGTGQHPTTGFCLREIVRHAQNGKHRSFLDMGTGSGILAIAATKLGYGPVEAFDFDPQCVKVSRDNARRNRVGDKLRIVQADLTKLPNRPTKQFDFVCANLLANLLITERDRILARVKRNGIVVIAGILKSEFSDVQEVYEAAGWQLIASKTENEWRSGTFSFGMEANS